MAQPFARTFRPLQTGNLATRDRIMTTSRGANVGRGGPPRDRRDDYHAERGHAAQLHERTDLLGGQRRTEQAILTGHTAASRP